MNATVNAGVDRSDQHRRDNDGWERFRGKGTRGGPPRVKIDNDDLVAAAKMLEAGRQALAYAASPEVQEQGRITKAGVVNAALSQLAHAARYIDDIVDRRTPRVRGE